jgi:hypothetical protein
MKRASKGQPTDPGKPWHYLRTKGSRRLPRMVVAILIMMRLIWPYDTLIVSCSKQRQPMTLYKEKVMLGARLFLITGTLLLMVVFFSWRKRQKTVWMLQILTALLMIEEGFLRGILGGSKTNEKGRN